jgi:hypothetical protein
MTNNLSHTVLVFLTSLFLAIAANGAEVTRVYTGGTLVWVGGFPVQQWKINDSLCMYQGDGVVACGAITAMTTDKVAVKLVERKRQLVAGEMVTLRKNLRSPATTASVSEQIEDSSKRTTVAMGAGMMPIALGIGADPSFRAPMATVVIGGLITSTFLSLLVIPVVYGYVDDVAQLVKRLLGGVPDRAMASTMASRCGPSASSASSSTARART